MGRIPTKLVPVLLYTGERGITPPIERIDDDLREFYGPDVTFAHIDYPRLSTLLMTGGLDHRGMLQTCYTMGQVVATFSKYCMQDADQNLGNWLVRHDSSVVKIDFDPKYTTLVEGADPRDVDFWIAANVDREHKYPGTRRIPRAPHTAYRCLSLVTSESGVSLPDGRDAGEYQEMLMEGFRKEFAIPPEKTYEELWGAYVLKSRRDAEMRGKNSGKDTLNMLHGLKPYSETST
ncbi:MAG: hypothetical protein HYY37_00970 [Candidatus Aenigmarchaeota archaeon]|nr:hypothetical protein [Candidatus Aenigmarchaeota archaeon]